MDVSLYNEWITKKDLSKFSLLELRNHLKSVGASPEKISGTKEDVLNALREKICVDQNTIFNQFISELERKQPSKTKLKNSINKIKQTETDFEIYDGLNWLREAKEKGEWKWEKHKESLKYQKNKQKDNYEEKQRKLKENKKSIFLTDMNKKRSQKVECSKIASETFQTKKFIQKKKKIKRTAKNYSSRRENTVVTISKGSKKKKDSRDELLNKLIFSTLSLFIKLKQRKRLLFQSMKRRIDTVSFIKKNREIKKAIIIQSTFRCFSEKRKYLKKVKEIEREMQEELIVYVQAAVRGQKTRRKTLEFILKREKYVVSLQRKMRKRKKKRGKSIEKSAVKIQRKFREKKVLFSLRKKEENDRTRVIFCQKKWREFQAKLCLKYVLKNVKIGFFLKENSKKKKILKGNFLLWKKEVERRKSNREYFYRKFVKRKYFKKFNKVKEEKEIRIKMKIMLKKVMMIVSSEKINKFLKKYLRLKRKKKEIKINNLKKNFNPRKHFLFDGREDLSKEKCFAQKSSPFHVPSKAILDEIFERY